MQEKNVQTIQGENTKLYLQSALEAQKNEMRQILNVGLENLQLQINAWGNKMQAMENLQVQTNALSAKMEGMSLGCTNMERGLMEVGNQLESLSKVEQNQGLFAEGRAMTARVVHMQKIQGFS